MLFRYFWVGALVVLLMSVRVWSDEIRLRADGLGDYATIQAAIMAAGGGDEIILAEGLYRGAGNRDLDMGGKALTIRSEAPEDAEVVGLTIIDCQGSALEYHRGFYFHSGEGSGSVLSGLTIENGYQFDGGAIYCENGSSPTFRNCVIRYNEAIEDGGGIKCSINCNPVIIGCDISNNTAGHYAGGIDCCLSSKATIINCRISFNQSVNDGGGLQACLSDVTVKDCVFEGNVSQAEGGGMFCRGECEIRGCLFVGNRAKYGGGIHFWNLTSPAVINCTIANNRADSYGGGFSGETCNPTLTGCILWGNTAIYGDQVAVDYHSTSGSVLTFSYCCVAGGAPSFYCPPSCTVNWGAGNITGDPLFFDGGNWDTNSTLEYTRDDSWMGGDYHLQSIVGRWDGESWIMDEFQSPCIDSGDPAMVCADEFWPHGGQVNMGSYGGIAEASMSLNFVGNKADMNCDGKVNLIDWNLFGEQWLKQDVLLKSDLNWNGLVDSSDLNMFIREWLWVEEPDDGGDR
ncbi:MAG: hypothetical protein GY869_25920 [Planctomycetes bacterium]|nr:hypothetical protein [Planctomycetota bacterium]